MRWRRKGSGGIALRDMDMSGQIHAPAALAPDNNLICDWMNPRAGLDAVG